MLYILTGDLRSGKTTFLRDLAEELRLRAVRVSGILSVRRLKDDGTDGYDAVGIPFFGSELLCTDRKEAGFITWEIYHFNPAGFAFGDTVFDAARHDRAEVFILDEIGPLEVEGKGWANLLGRLLNAGFPVAIVTIRRSMLERVTSGLDGLPWRVWDITRSDVKKMAGLVEDALADPDKSCRS
jgi:nucleoside-triphosphatase THEP1